MTDIESFWHYTIFLQSVLLFIKTKESENEIDQDYQYALQSFCHYTQWLLDNEKPYLESADLLVYPNDTWIAQDCRKLYLLKGYLKYCSSETKEAIHHKITLFEDYIGNYFEQNKNETTRILAILMQNQINKTEDDSSKYAIDHLPALKLNDKRLTIAEIVMQIPKDLFLRLFKINLKNEYLWLKSRLKN